MDVIDNESIKQSWRADIMEGLRRIPIAAFLAWGDTRARYRRSVLGPFWLTLGAAVGVGGLGYLWSILLKTDKATFIPSLTIGLILWQLIAGCITESPMTFVRQAHVIRNLNVPYFFYVLQTLLKHAINLLHNAVVIVVVLIIYPPQISPITLLSLLGLVLLFLNLAWIIMLMGMLGARLRDMEPLLQAFVPMLFFVSPVIFKAEHLGISQNIIWLNPVSHLLSVVRDPLLGKIPPLFVYGVTVGLLLAGWMVTIYLFKRSRSRIAYWV